jgi:hypothetical protein
MGRTGRKYVKGKKSKPIQCAYCIDVIQGEVRYARHILSKHQKHIEDYIAGKA